MAVSVVTGDIFQSGADVLVNPVNTIGALGTLAYVFGQKFPDDCGEYIDHCDDPGMKPGEVFFTCQTGIEIAHFATVRDPGGASQMAWIRKGLSELDQWIQEIPEIETIAMPALGCGVGGLEFAKVEAAVKKVFAKKDRVTVLLYQPR